MKITPETFGNIYIYSPTKVKHHLTCFNNIFSNNELISNKKKYIDKNIGWCLTFVGVYIYMYTFYYCNKGSKYTSSLKSDLSLALVL
jgi:hypothetical protein